MALKHHESAHVRGCPGGGGEMEAQSSEVQTKIILNSALFRKGETLLSFDMLPFALARYGSEAGT